MKSYFCINTWVSNCSYLPSADEDENLPSVLIQINDELSFNKGDQIFLNRYMFLQLHEEAKKLIKSWYINTDNTITHEMVVDMIRHTEKLNYLSIVFGFNIYGNKDYTISEYIEHHDPTKLYDAKEEKENLDFFFEELYDGTIIRVANVIHDLRNLRKIYELEIEEIYY